MEKNRKAIPRLTDLEITIMKVLWEQDHCLTIQEIANHLTEKKLSIASVTQAMKHLIEKNAAAVDEHVLVSNVYARTFTPCFSREEFLAGEFKRMQKSVFGAKKANLVGVIANLLDMEGDGALRPEEAEALQRIIDRRSLRDKEE